MEPFVSFLGLFVLMFLAWLMSSNRNVVNLRVIVGGLLLQFAMAYLVLRTRPGQAFFEAAGRAFNELLGCVDAGSRFVFGDEYTRYFFAFRILPTIIFFAALMSLLYYLNIMQVVIRGLTWVMQRTLRTSGAETLSTSANIFVGQTEAPLVVKPYIGSMTDSEIMCIMVGGFATTAGGVLAACVGMGIDAGHLMAASVIAAPATILISKLIQPEVDRPVTADADVEQPKSPASNAVDAVTLGAGEGLMLAFNVAACLIVFLALIELINRLMTWSAMSFGGLVAASLDSTLQSHFGKGPGSTATAIFADSFGRNFADGFSLQRILGWVFSPLAFVLGVGWEDAKKVGELLGIRMVTNELVAYSQLSQWMAASATANADPVLSQRAMILATYALSGFANFSSIGIQVGGIGPMAPHRQKDIARLGLRAMLGGTLATMMTACVAGVFLSDDDMARHAENLRNWKIMTGK
jgi:concentrative nucleoside transporter, CNT family